MAREATVVADVDTAPTQEAVVQFDPVIVAPTTKVAKVKGTWTQYWGDKVFEFEDRHRYELPLDLYEYLVKRDCIYDTL